MCFGVSVHIFTDIYRKQWHRHSGPTQTPSLNQNSIYASSAPWGKPQRRNGSTTRSLWLHIQWVISYMNWDERWDYIFVYPIPLNLTITYKFINLALSVLFFFIFIYYPFQNAGKTWCTHTPRRSIKSILKMPFCCPSAYFIPYLKSEEVSCIKCSFIF